jgi:hypothetical protein
VEPGVGLGGQRIQKLACGQIHVRLT